MVSALNVFSTSLMIFKQQYWELCTQKTLPLFMQAWWLDIVCGEPKNWEVALSKDKSGKIIGALPYFTTRIKGVFPAVFMPNLTPFMGIWLDYPTKMTKMEAKLSWEHRVLNELIDQLPNKPFFEQRYSTTLTNWLPFYWKGFQQTTRYTYVLDDLSNLDAIWQGLKDTVRNKIRKAQKLVLVEKIETATIEQLHCFYTLNQKTFARQGKKIPYSFELVQKIDLALAQRGQRILYLAKDTTQKDYHAGVYMVWDTQTAYCLLTGGDTELRTSGAIQLLLWRAIEDISKKGLAFDFEGSMLPHVEPMYRAFGATPKPYFSITKEKNKLLSGIKLLFRK